MKMSMSEAGKLGAIKSNIVAAKNKQKRIDEYNKNPLCCNVCKISIPYEKYVLRRKKERDIHNSFCGRSCAAKHNNKLFPKRPKDKKYCIRCKIKQVNIKDFCQKCIKIIDYENFLNDDHNFSSGKVRRMLLKTYGNKCMLKDCGWDWSKPCVVEVDHINGKSEDNRMENLRLICPNCHSQTSTYKAKNIGNGRHKRRQRYLEGKSY